MAEPRRILGLSGSLRAVSSHRALLEQAGSLCPDGWGLDVFAGLADLPAFDPDQDAAEGLPSVQAWRTALKASGALLICTPEYAHGIPGSVKNALDWVVGSGELVDKPVGIITGTPFTLSGSWLERSLVEVLKTMNARILEGALLNLPGLRGKGGVVDGAYDPQAVRGLLKALALAAR